MLYLFLAILSSALVSLLMRLSEGRASARTSMLAANYLICVAVAGAYIGFENCFPAVPGIGFAAGLGTVNGVLYLLGFLLLQLNVRKNGVVLSSTFMKLGLLVPIVLSVCCFGEAPTPLQILGFLLAVAAILLINFERGQAQMSFKSGLILLLLAGGGGDAMSKVYEQLGNNTLSGQFLFYTFLTALLLCVGLTLYKRERPGVRDVLFGFLIGIPNYFSARFLLRALEHLPAVIVYPTFSVATIVVVTLAGVCFFREQLGRRQWTGVGTILAALALLNL